MTEGNVKWKSRSVKKKVNFDRKSGNVMMKTEKEKNEGE